MKYSMIIMAVFFAGYTAYQVGTLVTTEFAQMSQQLHQVVSINH